jgi:hypothetical protein
VTDQETRELDIAVKDGKIVSCVPEAHWLAWSQRRLLMHREEISAPLRFL